MTTTKKIKVSIYNRSGQPLKVHCLKCNLGKDGDEFEVRNKSVIKLLPGRYQLILFYDCRNVILKTKGSDAIEVGDIPAPDNNQCQGKIVILNYPEKKTKIYCREQYSVASILSEGHI